jgi:glycine hydroxymethyltransferase
LTSRGMGVDEMRDIGRWMLTALRSPEDDGVQEKIRDQVRQLCTQFPTP